MTVIKILYVGSTSLYLAISLYGAFFRFKQERYFPVTINSAIDVSGEHRSGRLCLSDEPIGEDVLLHYTLQ